MNKPNPLILLVGNNRVCGLALISSVIAVVVSLENGQYWLITAVLILLSIRSIQANRQVRAYECYKKEWDKASDETPEISENRRRARRRSRILGGALLWAGLGYLSLKFPRGNDPQLYGWILLAFVATTLLGGYVLMRARNSSIPGGVFNRSNKKEQDHIVSQCQNTPATTPTVAQINRQLPDYCKPLLDRKP